MNVFSSLTEAAEFLRGGAIAIGNFDGVHVGHQALFAATVRQAKLRGGRAAALTFEPHPAQVLAPRVAPPRLSSLASKLALMQRLGLEGVVVQPFDAAYAQSEPEAFAVDLFERAQVSEVVVGFDFTYGRRRAGNVESLRQAGAARGAQVTVIDKVTVDGLPASSTKVRELLLEGNVGGAASLLGRHPELEGPVIHGLARGRTIGFPTANLAPRPELLAASGVYAAVVEAAGRWWAAAANLGRKPTFGGDEGLTIELHLLDFAGDLYGQSIRALLVERLRPEQRFSGIEALREQIGRDVIQARQAARHAVQLALDPPFALSEA